MTYLALANILHRKLGSALASLGIALSVCMLITLSGLSRGSLNEVLDRWAGIDAELVVCPSSASLSLADGGAMRIELAERIQQARRDDVAIVQAVAPVYLARMEIADRPHNVFGIQAGDWPTFAGQSRLLRGRLPDETGAFASWLAERFADAGESGEVLDIPAEVLAERRAYEIAIDTRLARMLGKDVGEAFYAAGRTWQIVGVYEAGAVSRAVASMASLQHHFNGPINRVTMLFVKLADGVPTGVAAETIRGLTRQAVVPTGEYRATLMQNVGVMYVYVDAVNIMALVIAFLFIMVTLHTMVLQRMREIAILKSMGASAWRLLGGVLAESLILTAAGTAGGVALSYLAGWAIERARPDLTVTITTGWIATAVLASTVGALLAGLLPAWRAIRVDVAETLAME